MPRRTPPAKGPDWSPEKALPLLKEQLRRLSEFKGKTFSQVEHDEEEWEQFTRSVIIHAFGDDSQNLKNHFYARSAGVYNMMGISDHQRQLNFVERISKYEATLKSSIRELEANFSETQPAIEIVEETWEEPKEGKVSGPLIMISHSSKDKELALALIELLHAGLGLLSGQIRCSSVDGYRLPAGVTTDTQLRSEVNQAKVLIGLITPNSLASPYVLFELGARWGAGSALMPLLAGVSADELRGPLSGMNSLSCGSEAQLHQFLGDVGGTLQLTVQSAASCVRYVSALKAKADAFEVGLSGVKQEKLVFEQSVRWKKTDGVLEGPYCPTCYEDKQKEIHLNPGATRGTYSCGVCKNGFRTAEYNPPPPGRPPRTGPWS